MRGVPPDYFERLDAVEERHWWHRGMRAISAALLGERLDGGAVLDAGCGTGGFLRWLLRQGSFERACGFDPSDEALAFARRRLPDAELARATLATIPFDDASFELVVSNDVLQHVPEQEVGASLRELARVLRPGGTLLLRTNGARQSRRERADWRVYDRSTLIAALEAAGLPPSRATYANFIGSALDAFRGRPPHAPDTETHGIPELPPAPVGAAMLRLLVAEARFLARPGRRLPCGHTLLAVAGHA
jgi:SAM-dependent methyltransferase